MELVVIDGGGRAVASVLDGIRRARSALHDNVPRGPEQRRTNVPRETGRSRCLAAKQLADAAAQLGCSVCVVFDRRAPVGHLSVLAGQGAHPSAGQDGHRVGGCVLCVHGHVVGSFAIKCYIYQVLEKYIYIFVPMVWAEINMTDVNRLW